MTEPTATPRRAPWMSGRFGATLAALILLNVAACSNWFIAEFFFYSEMAVEVLAASAVNLAIVAGLALLVKFALGEGRSIISLRALMLFVLCFVGLRFVALASWAPDGSPLVWRPVAAVLLAALGTFMLPEAFWTRATRAIIAASIAFTLAPPVWSSLRAPQVDWMVTSSRSSIQETNSPANKVLLLLDELGDLPAAPLVEALRKRGLHVESKSLIPAGSNTFNVVPAMFTGRDFSQPKPCGFSSVCSGTNVLNFKKIRARRSDIDVVGLSLPYCKINGLRYCVRKALPWDYSSAYLRLSNVYLSRFGIILKSRNAKEARKFLTNDVIDLQLRGLREAPFWTKGGLLFAHVALPHPPGSGPVANLDTDYEENIYRAIKLVDELVSRLNMSFGSDYALTIFSDHPLRDWCDSGHYTSNSCKTRALYQTNKVPLIVASPRPVQLPNIDSNIHIFSTF